MPRQAARWAEQACRVDEELIRPPPSNLWGGMVLGTRGLGSGLYGGFAGMVSQPATGSLVYEATI